MRLAPRNWANALFLWLSLATVLVPAIGSSGSPLRLTEGSAFSAFTSDVSLGPSRAAPIEDEGTAQTAPGGGGGSASHVRFALAAPALGPAPALAAPGTAFDPPSPRPARFAAGAIGARAPPGA
jgi:hypothetical protein